MSGTILVVDDEPSVRQMLARLLAQDGYKVEAVGCAREALACLNQTDVDLVITDLKMPGADGLTLAQQLLRQDPSRPVMIMTGYSDVESARKALQMGIYEYFTKPMDTSEVLTRVQRALERRQLVLDNLAYQRTLERQVSERTAELEQTQQKLLRSERLATAGRLATVIAHEVLNPVSVVSGRLDLVLMRDQVNGSDRASLEEARQNVNSVVVLLNQLKQLGGDAKGQYLDVDLKQLIGDLLSEQ